MKNLEQLKNEILEANHLSPDDVEKLEAVEISLKAKNMRNKLHKRKMIMLSLWIIIILSTIIRLNYMQYMENQYMENNVMLVLIYIVFYTSHPYFLYITIISTMFYLFQYFSTKHKIATATQEQIAVSLQNIEKILYELQTKQTKKE